MGTYFCEKYNNLGHHDRECKKRDKQVKEIPLINCEGKTSDGTETTAGGEDEPQFGSFSLNDMGEHGAENEAPFTAVKPTTGR